MTNALWDKDATQTLFYYQWFILMVLLFAFLHRCVWLANTKIMFQMVSFSVTYLYSFTPMDANEIRSLDWISWNQLALRVSVLGPMQNQLSLYRIIWQKISHIYELENCIYFFSCMLMLIWLSEIQIFLTYVEINRVFVP